MAQYARCSKCGTVLCSKFRHDFQLCNCENESYIDGGDDYLRAGGVNPLSLEIYPSDAFNAFITWKNEELFIEGDTENMEQCYDFWSPWWQCFHAGWNSRGNDKGKVTRYGKAKE